MAAQAEKFAGQIKACSRAGQNNRKSGQRRKIFQKLLNIQNSSDRFLL